MSDVTPDQKALDAELDKALLKGVREGVAFITKDGEVVKVEAPAAFLNVARQRLKDLGLSKIATPDSDLAQLMKECKFTPSIAPLNDEPDAATDGREERALTA